MGSEPNVPCLFLPRFLLGVGIGMLCVSVYGQDAPPVKISARVDPPVIRVGARVRYRVTVETTGSVNPPAPKLPAFDPFAVLDKTTASQTFMTMGQAPRVALIYDVILQASDAGTSLTEAISVRYDTLAYPLRLRRELTNVSYRTIVTAHDTLTCDGAEALAHQGE